MMGDFWHWLILSLVQGLTEFLPVSSSAHLILVGKLGDWQDQGLIIDIAAHMGSLLAVLIYFRRDLIELISGRQNNLLVQIIIATIPIALVGLVVADQVAVWGRSFTVIAFASAFFGVILWLSQRAAADAQLTIKNTLLIGLAQCLALIPGASRSGVTITAAMMLGLSKENAARFSFLLAIPTLLMATGYAGLKWFQNPQAVSNSAILIVLVLSFIFSWLSISVFMKFIKRIDFVWFMLYRLILAALLLLVI